MKKIIIVGAGGFGRELLQWIKDINKQRPAWEIAGFIDDDLHALDDIKCHYKIIGTIKDWKPKSDEEFALAIGTPATKVKVVELLERKGAKFATVIHPSAILTEYSEYGQGLVMFPNAKLSVNSKVGDFVTILSSGVGHDVLIGDYTTISGMCSVTRNVKIGNRVFIAANVGLAQDVEVGDDAYIGIGSVVIKDIPAGKKVFGNPARIMPA